MRWLLRGHLLKTHKSNFSFIILLLLYYNYISCCHLGQGITSGENNKQKKLRKKSWEMKQFRKQGLWKVPTYSWNGGPHACPELDTCSEKIWEGPKILPLLITRFWRSRKWGLKQSCQLHYWVFKEFPNTHTELICKEWEIFVVVVLSI